MIKPTEKITICSNCVYHTGNSCKHPDAPVSEYEYGIKFCKEINKGHCEYYQRKNIEPPPMLRPQKEKDGEKGLFNALFGCYRG